MSLQTDIKKLPDLPGVYRYYDREGILLYIGKAKNLKKRVGTYFVERNDQPARTRIMVKQISQIEYTTVSSEKDAFLLENALIKEYQPKYNIELKDDKSYPYIVIVNEPFPRIFLTRNPKKDGSEYFGPFTSVHQVRGILDVIKKMYPIRSCSLHLSTQNIRKRKFKVCLEYHIGNCLGPCEALQPEDAYLGNIAHIRNMIKGKLGLVKQALKAEMDAHVNDLAFEQAEKIKKRLDFLSNYISSSTIVNPRLSDLDVFGYSDDELKAYIHYFKIVEGTIVKVKSLQLNKKLEEDPEEILAYGVLEILGTNLQGHHIITPFEIPLLSGEAIWQVPKAGEKKKLLDLAQRNAIEQRLKGTDKVKNTAQTHLMQQMQKDLRIQELPLHIECFDNSNLQGSSPVASVVVFKNGKPSVKDYRNFNIKTVVGANDFASMKEIVTRRYKRLIEDGLPLPQLVVIDGGKGQLSSACEAIEELGLHGKMQIISIAKRLEEIYYPGDTLPMHISKKSETLKVLQHIRNEAHRFAITFHRKKRNMNTFKSSLTGIEGIGEKTIISLLKVFKSENKIKAASVEEIAALVGNDKARRILQALSSR